MALHMCPEKSPSATWNRKSLVSGAILEISEFAFSVSEAVSLTYWSRHRTAFDASVGVKGCSSDPLAANSANLATSRYSSWVFGGRSSLPMQAVYLDSTVRISLQRSPVRYCSELPEDWPDSEDPKHSAGTDRLRWWPGWRKQSDLEAGINLDSVLVVSCARESAILQRSKGGGET